jgi:hypothetical protein
LNPRPKTIIPGFYMLILNFKIGPAVSFRRDTAGCSLNNSTVQDQATGTAVLQSRRPGLRSARGISAGRKLVLSSYSVVIIVCDYV